MSDELRLAIGARLGKVLADERVSQREFARRVGISQGYLSELLKGKNNPGAELLHAINREFGISIDWLLLGDAAVSRGRGPSGVSRTTRSRVLAVVLLEWLATIEDNTVARRILDNVRANRPMLDGLRAPEHRDDAEDVVIEVHRAQRVAEFTDVICRHLAHAGGGQSALMDTAFSLAAVVVAAEPEFRGPEPAFSPETLEMIHSISSELGAHFEDSPSPLASEAPASPPLAKAAPGGDAGAVRKRPASTRRRAGG